jgi:rubredoxin
MIFGGPKDDGKPGDYVCLDCGYVFTKGPKAWAELPSNWSCPPCGSAKRRFKKVPKGSAGKSK